MVYVIVFNAFVRRKVMSPLLPVAQVGHAALGKGLNGHAGRPDTKKCRRGWRGEATAALLETLRQPGEGDEAAAGVRHRRGTGLAPDFGKYRRCRFIWSSNVEIQGHEHYNAVTCP